MSWRYRGLGDVMGSGSMTKVKKRSGGEKGKAFICEARNTTAVSIFLGLIREI